MTRPLNLALRALPDGALALSVQIAYADGVGRHFGRVWVFWPFVVYREDRYPAEWTITHALSGYRVSSYGTLRDSAAFIRRLRKATDWHWWSPRSRKGTAARRQAAKRLPVLRSVA